MPRAVLGPPPTPAAPPRPRRRAGPVHSTPAPSATPPALASAGRVYSFEVLALAVSLVGAAAALFIPLDPLALLPGRMVDTLSIAFVIILSLRAAVPVSRWWRRRNELPDGSLWPMIREAFGGRYVGFVIRSVLSIQVVMLWFCILKYLLPMVRPFDADALLWLADEKLHLISPSELAAALFHASPRWLRAVDIYYSTYFPLLVIFTAYVLIQERRPDLRAPFVLGYCVLWVAGGLAYYVLPSVGPCYHAPRLFAESLRHMPIAGFLQHQLWTDHVAFVADPWHHRPQLYYGIAAMPSLHVAACAYFAFFARRLGRTPAAAMWLVTALTFGASIITGWHYAVDGYAGLALGWLASRVTRYGHHGLPACRDAQPEALAHRRSNAKHLASSIASCDRIGRP